MSWFLKRQSFHKLFVGHLKTAKKPGCHCLEWNSEENNISTVVNFEQIQNIKFYRRQNSENGDKFKNGDKSAINRRQCGDKTPQQTLQSTHFRVNRLAVQTLDAQNTRV